MDIKLDFRGFIAIEVPASIKDEIERLQRKIEIEGIKCRFVKPGNIHLTIVFLGNVKNDDALPLVDMIGSKIKDFRPFKASLNSIGAFPDLERPRVLWAGINDGVDEIRELRERAADCARNFGFDIEEREFRPHLTIARFKSRTDTGLLKKIIDKNKSRNFGQFNIEYLTFFKSDLKPQGPVYTPVSKIKIG